jgi:RimJ/RimL family protein N-acetyltransferase
MPFELQPILSGELIELRPLAPADRDEMFAVASDPLIWEQHPASDRYQEPVFREFFAGALSCGGGFAILDKQTRQIIGSTRYFGYDEFKSEIEIGWTFLARKYWGGTYNRELKRLMLDHAFQFVERVLFFVGEHNLRSQKAMEKIGGVRVPSMSKRHAGGLNVCYVIKKPS